MTTEIKKNNREVEVKVNDRIRVLITIDDKMDPNSFFEMMNHVKNIVRQNVPLGEFSRGVGRPRNFQYKPRAGLEERKKLALGLFKKGKSNQEVMKELNRGDTTVKNWHKEFLEKGLI